MMEQKKGKPTEVKYLRLWETQNGDVHIFQVAFDNGDLGQYMAKGIEQTAFVVGTSVAYTIETKTNGKFTNTIVKPVRPPGMGRPTIDPRHENKRVALQCAVSLAVAGKIDNLAKIKEYAESFLKFLSN